MAFLPLIPQATDKISISQGNILNDFTILGAIAGNGNPASASINNNSGFNWIFLPSQGSAPGNTPPPAAAFPAGTIGIYSAINPVTGLNDIYVNKTNNTPPSTAVVQVPITGSILSTFGNITPSNAPGWTYLPSGILLKWASSMSATGELTVSFPTGSNIPAFTTCFAVILTVASGVPGDTNTAIRLISQTPTTFTVFGSPRTSTGTALVGYNYLAIGF
jgi:hypothetical protein